MRLACVRVTVETHAKLDRLIRERRRPYAAIVRDAIDRDYQKEFGDEPPPPPRRAPKLEPSVTPRAPRRSSAARVSR